MNFIFLDNYRGFKETLIEIESVNFLVGENSTGKTSVLGLLNLLSSSEFWMNREFNLRKIGLGTFKDVVSIGAEDKSYFSIGMVFDKPEKDDSKSIYAYMMTFVENEGVPKLSSIVSYKDNHEIRIKYFKESIRYKHREILYSGSAESFGKTKMKGWVNIHKTDTSGYSMLQENKLFFKKNIPPIILLSYIENQIAEEEGITEKFNGAEITSFFNDIAWLAPIRSKPRKTYDEYSLEFSPEGDHTPYLIKKKLGSKSESKEFNEQLKEIGKNSGLFKEVQIKNYGRGNTSPFELDIVLSEEPLSIGSVGYGVSQALPVIVEMFTRKNRSWFAIQQPEVHLHPKAQAALGELIFDLASREEKNFVIETHSDYTIDRYRISCRKSKKIVSSQILFFERTKKGNKLTAIKIDKNGDFSENQPESYREFFLKEEMELLGL